MAYRDTKTTHLLEEECRHSDQRHVLWKSVPNLLRGLLDELTVRSIDASCVRLEWHQVCQSASNLDDVLDQSEGRRQGDGIDHQLDLSSGGRDNIFCEGRAIVVHNVRCSKALEELLVLLGGDGNYVGVACILQKLCSVLPRRRPRSVYENRALAVGGVLGRPFVRNGQIKLVEQREESSCEVVRVCDGLFKG